MTSTMDMTRKKMTFGVIIGVRGFFNPELAVGDRADLEKLLSGLGIESVTLPPEATASGAIETPEDAEKLAALFQSRRSDIDGVLVVLPNFGDEQAVAETLKAAALNVPVLVQASDDEADKVDLANRRDAFCGKLSVCNNLRQYGIPFTDTSAHTCRVAGADFAKDVADFAALCRVVRGMRTAKIGMIGTRPAAFQTVRCSEKLLQATGVKVVPVDMSVIIAGANRVKTDEQAYTDKLAEITGYADMTPTPAQLEKLVKYSVAVERFTRDNGLAATAVQCWDSLQNNFGCGKVRPGGMTYFRISTEDTGGYVKGYVGEGEFIDKPFEMDGGIAVCRIEKMRKLFRFLCANGFEHHVAMARGGTARILREAAAKYLGWRVYWHNMPEELDVPVL